MRGVHICCCTSTGLLAFVHPSKFVKRCIFLCGPGDLDYGFSYWRMFVNSTLWLIFQNLLVRGWVSLNLFKAVCFLVDGESLQHVACKPAPQDSSLLHCCRIHWRFLCYWHPQERRELSSRADKDYGNVMLRAIFQHILSVCPVRVVISHSKYKSVTNNHYKLKAEGFPGTENIINVNLNLNFRINWVKWLVNKWKPKVSHL